MENSWTDAVPSASYPVSGYGRGTVCEEPSERAYPFVLLTPVHATHPMARAWTEVDWSLVVAGIAVLVFTAELGRRAGATARLTAFCSAASLAVVVVVPRLVCAVPRPRFRAPSTAAAR
ncbi:hypothetical protein GCM10022254_19180 [Actinomadura meridiana]|uniref:Uncharacterized protein n=1 Tax=Actinomadura meridiana TaxID=559626 RepID=A0ABP8BWP4_9ACTN